MMCPDARFISLAILLVSTMVSSSPLPEPKDSKVDVPTTNGNQFEPLFVLMDDEISEEPSEFFVLDTVFTEAKQDEKPASDAKGASSDAKETEGNERIFFKKFVVAKPVAVPVPVMPVAFMRPPAPQVVRVPNTFYVVVGAQNPHVYALRPPHYRPALISTGLSGLTGGSLASLSGLTGGSLAGLSGLSGGSFAGLSGLTGGSFAGLSGLTGGSFAGLSGLTGGSLAGLSPLTGMAGLGVQRPQPVVVESSLTTALPQPMPVSPPVVMQPQPVPSPSLISGMLSNLMSLGSKVPTAPVQPSPSMPVFSRPPLPPPTSLNLQIQKVVDVMAHAKETAEKKEEN